MVEGVNPVKVIAIVVSATGLIKVATEQFELKLPPVP